MCSPADKATYLHQLLRCAHVGRGTHLSHPHPHATAKHVISQCMIVQEKCNDDIAVVVIMVQSRMFSYF